MLGKSCLQDFRSSNSSDLKWYLTSIKRTGSFYIIGAPKSQEWHSSLWDIMSISFHTFWLLVASMDFWPLSKPMEILFSIWCIYISSITSFNVSLLKTSFWHAKCQVQTHTHILTHIPQKKRAWKISNGVCTQNPTSCSKIQNAEWV